ncbi:aminomethyltransferase [Cavenderia fasciculata]|uniref:Aminomethyltransferase n=1 Tax=Cavenderia fasciculata TaxID=261658 RepID=F4PVN3_CACFS|nr:aminomethyltransferase [Cavenderia fasciculata]EGG20047.1 aminomethyltransferase [Cavenderia fasciculata]|eukprot:XP_004367030.1 aminomethyltransferase [Cavenderia fasciculata]
MTPPNVGEECVCYLFLLIYICILDIMSSVTIFSQLTSKTLMSSSVRTISCSSRFKCTTTQQPLKKTALNKLHRDLGAKMVEFCGWDMPLMYPTGVLTEHMHCRQKSALFDVSHMGQLRLHGRDRIEFMESISVADLQAAQENKSKLSVFTTENGGIIDDTMITKKADSLYVVVNAGCADKDIAHMNNKIAEFRASGKDVAMELMGDSALVAVQGPETERIVSQVLGRDLSKMEFMTQMDMTLDGIDLIVTRCGYTGEDGFEISVPNKHAEQFTRMLLDAESGVVVKPAGLGARDSLRLEAGLCLYGHDMDETITPIEASLAWLITKRRREQGGFPGASIIQQQLKEGVSKKRVGLLSGIPVREGAVIVDNDGKAIGKITSGTVSPVTKQYISMGYVPTESSKAGSNVTITIRNKPVKGEVVVMPFVKTNYKRL